MIGLIIGGAVLAAIIIFVVIIAASSSKKKQEAKNTTEYTTQATTTATDDTTYTTTEADTTDTTTEATTETTTEATTEVATGDMYPDIYGVPDNICYGGLLAFSSDGQEFDIDRKNSRIALDLYPQLICTVNVPLCIFRTREFHLESVQSKAVVDALTQNSAGGGFSFQNNQG
jgi:hypothetical protein